MKTRLEFTKRKNNMLKSLYNSETTWTGETNINLYKEMGGEEFGEEKTPVLRKAAGWILTCSGLYYLLRFSQMLQKSLDGTS